MSLSIQLTPGYLFQDDDLLTPDILRAIARPNILLVGTIGSLSIADGAVTTVKLADGVLSADTAGRAKIANGFILLDMIGAGIFTADTAGRAPFAAGFVTAALMDEATLAGAASYADGTQVATTYQVTLSPVPTAYHTGEELIFKADTANAGDVSVNKNGLGDKHIYKNVSDPLAANDILAGQIVRLVYDGTNYQLAHPIPIPSTDLQIKFAGTPTSKTVTNTVDTVNMRLTVTGHGMLTGQCFSLRNSGGALPTSSPSLAINTAYFARVIDANTIEAYTTAANALAGTSKITLTGSGSGTNTLDYITPISATGCAVIQLSSAGSLVAGQFRMAFSSAQANNHYVATLATKAADTNHVPLAAISSADAGSTSSLDLVTYSMNTGSGSVTLANLPETHVRVTAGT